MLAKNLPAIALLITSSGTFQSLHAQQSSNVLTWHNDSQRTGSYTSETNLTHANVNADNFGKLGFFATDAAIDAQPLYVGHLTVKGASHDVLFIASEKDTVYAKDVHTAALLWKTSLLKPGETSSDSRGCSQISPHIGVTSTPVIDLSRGAHGVIYLVSMSQDAKGAFHQRINALDLVTGQQVFGGPTEIQAKYPGTGDDSSNGQLVFDPAHYAERTALLEWRGTIYTTWTSHCDQGEYTGWVIGYDAATLKQNTIFNITPNGSKGAVWMAGAGPAAGENEFYLLDGNGTFDTTLNSSGFPANKDYGNAAIALAPSGSGLHVTDYYATDTTVQQSNADTDFGSGGIMLIPPTPDSSGTKRSLAVAAGKDHNIYLLDRSHMGGYHPEGGSIYQVLSGALPNGEWSAPAYFDNKVYYGGVHDNLKAFNLHNARFLTTPDSRSTTTFSYPGTTPSISSNGTANGIVWALLHASKSAVLYAYNADDLSETLYASNQSGSRDNFGAVDHFIAPTIANGRVYVPAQKGVVIFGLLPK